MKILKVFVAVVAVVALVCVYLFYGNYIRLRIGIGRLPVYPQAQILTVRGKTITFSGRDFEITPSAAETVYKVDPQVLQSDLAAWYISSFTKEGWQYEPSGSSSIGALYFDKGSKGIFISTMCSTGDRSVWANDKCANSGGTFWEVTVMYYFKVR